MLVCTKFIHLLFFSFITKDHLQYINSNIKVLIKSYTSSHYQTEVSCNECLFWESWGEFHVTDITFRNHFFGNYFPKQTYFTQFLIYNLYKHSSQGTWLSAENKLSFLWQRLPKFLCQTLLQTTKKSTSNFLCSLDTFSYELTIQTKII